MLYTETFKDSTGNAKLLEFRFHRESRMRYQTSDLSGLFDEGYKLLLDYIKHHESKQKPRIQELLDYAEGNNHTVCESGRRREADMADSRAIHNYGKYISTFKQGYLVGNPIRVEYEDNDDAKKQLFKELADKNNFHQLNRRLVKDLSKVGRAYELIYRSMDDKTEVVRLDPRETFIIYQADVGQASLVGVRYYNKSQLDRTKKTVEVYTDNEIIYFDYDGQLTEVDRRPHIFKSVPITEYLNTDDGLGDYETELSLIDLYDAAQSDTANYMQDLSDAILAIIGRVSFPSYVDTKEKAIEYLRAMRKARLLNLEPPVDTEGREGSVDAKYLYKQYDVNGTEAYKDRVVQDIHRFTNTPDMSDSKFAGTQSGEALKWKVFGLDQERVDLQALFEQSLKRRYKLIARVSELLKEIDGFDISKLKITFTPNLPKSLHEKIEAFKALGGELSQKTTMSITDIVENPDKEIASINDEAKNRSLLAQKMESEGRMTDRELARDYNHE
ncbi:phage portal protein [Streptococcus equi]|uniref:Putative phage portal protein n=1 Tax=Streptococcus equi subsp. equi (strain 4047) TaxID=553482 RepID=C0M6V6_STRE4|nr:phage portal protein [Streptococcus equi]QBX24264.1 portal protein [Streptococcus phage Javan180]HEL0722514.1 phage portal protein [Streptococcus equi subsp. zooepidemicus]ASB97440.1 putative phage portal protein [Streptococcus equi subsp. equi]MBT1194666.1 phage portal protein [Streptococcus equi subsp. equi]MBT1197496.1 phage portal protein [Streptococcus equi subsp. equi]